jgi:hypothetical protein
MQMISLQMFSIHPTLAFVVVYSIGVAPLSAAAVDDTVSTILNDWAKRRHIPAIQYELKGIRLWPRGAFDDETVDNPKSMNPPENRTGDIARKLLLDIPGNRFRVEWDEQHYDNLSKTLYTIRCLEVGDGSAMVARIFENGSPEFKGNRRKVDMLIERGEPDIMPPDIFTYSYKPLFLAHGIVTSGAHRVRPTLLSPPPITADQVTFEGTTTYNDKECVLLRIGNGQYWVDLARDSAILQIIAKPESPTSRLEIQYETTSRGWLPKRWEWSQFSAARLKYSEQIDVVSIDPNPVFQDSNFTMTPVPGMCVREVTYRLAATGELESQSSYYVLNRDGSKSEVNDHPLMPDVDNKIEVSLRSVFIGLTFLLILILAWYTYKSHRTA